MEYWNVEDPVFSHAFSWIDFNPAFGGIDFKKIFSFMEFYFKKIFPINHCHIFPEPIIPSFQYSIIPIAKLSSELTVYLLKVEGRIPLPL